MKLRYNYIISPFLYCLQFSYPPSSSFSNLWLIIFNCTHYTHTDTHKLILKYINRTYSVIVLLVHIWFQGWPLVIEQSIWGLFPGEDYFPHSQHSLIACSSLFRVEAPWDLSLAQQEGNNAWYWNPGQPPELS